VHSGTSMRAAGATPAPDDATLGAWCEEAYRAA
jgi:hypothetical protein